MNYLKAFILWGFRIVICFWAVTMLNLPVYAQEYRPGSPFITHYPKTVYQAGTQNWSIIQDNRDIIYIGNNHGLLEFDGVNWKKYGLPNRTIARSLAIDKTGNIFVGGQGEWGYFKTNGKGEQIYHSLLPYFPEEKRSFDDVWQTFVTDDGVIGISHTQLMRWDGKEIQILDAADDSRFDNAYQVAEKLYIHDWQQGLMLLAPDFTLKHMAGGIQLKQMRLAAILPLDAERLLVATAQQGLKLYDGKSFTPSSGPAHDFLKRYQAYCGIRLHDGNFAFGSPQNGLLIVNPEGHIIWHINKEKELTNNTVLSMFQDRQGHIWLGLDNGLNYVEINSPFSKLGPSEGIEGTGYTSLVHQGKVYLGTNQGLFVHDWPSREALNFQLIPELSGQVWSLTHLGDSTWVGHHQGAFIIPENRPKKLSATEGAWKFLPLDKHPGYAVGGTYNGLISYRKQAGKWIEVGPIPGFDESSRIMEEDGEGNLWMTHFYRGVFKLGLSSDARALTEVTSYDSSSGLPSSYSVNVCKIYDELVFTTLEGVYRYLPDLDRFEKHPVLDSVFLDNPPRWLWEAPGGEVWFSAGEEFGFLEVKSKGMRYKLQKVLLNRLQPSLVEGFEQVFSNDEKNVFIATEAGFVHYNPSFSAGVANPQQVHIREVRDPFTDTLMYAGGITDISRKDSLWKLPSHHHAVHFSFAASQFSNMANTQYRYQLIGFNKAWSSWEEKTEKEYNNLKSGTYTFNVQARNDLGTASTINSFSFKIATPWYLHAGSKIIWVLLLLSMLVGVFLLNRKRMNRKANELIQEKKVEMEQKEAAYQQEIVKNEEEILQLRNDKLRTEIDYKKQELGATTMHLLQKSEMLSKLKGELTKLSKQLPENQRGEVKRIIKTIEQDVKLDENWNSFEHHFDRVHEDFIKRLREGYPQLTPKDLKLAAYLRMNLVTKEIAPLLNISVRGVEISRYRLRKKLDLDREANLVEHMMNY